MKEEDIDKIIPLYQEVFAEEPWNEYMKCNNCGINYEKNEIKEGFVYDRKARKWTFKYPIVGLCKNEDCKVDLNPIITPVLGGNYGMNSKNFVLFWTDRDVRNEIEFCRSQESPQLIIAEKNLEIIGWTWGYKMPKEKFPFLNDLKTGNDIYWSDIGVAKSERRNGTAEAMSKEILNRFENDGINKVFGRTRIITKMYPLLQKLGFTDIGPMDPDDIYPDRNYIIKGLTKKNISKTKSYLDYPFPENTKWGR